MEPLVIYHGNCQDGFTAAWAIWKSHPDWEFYPGKYQEEPPDTTGRDVYLVDFSYKRQVILEMAEKAKSIVILDHHKTAEADLIDLPSNVSVTFDMEKSGSHLAWDRFHPKDRIPDIILIVEDHDLWRFRYLNTKAISVALSAEDYNFTTWTLWDMKLQRDGVEWAVQMGETILRKQAKDINELLKNKFKLVIAGYEVWAANLPYTLASDAGNILAKGEPFGATFYLDGKVAIFSLRSDEEGIDVSEVAKKFGGGGHKHAAGFKVDFSGYLFQSLTLLSYRG